MLWVSMEHTSDIERVEDRIKDLEVALYTFFTLTAVAQGVETATPEEVSGVQVLFAEAMERIKLRVGWHL